MAAFRSILIFEALLLCFSFRHNQFISNLLSSHAPSSYYIRNFKLYSEKIQIPTSLETLKTFLNDDDIGISLSIILINRDVKVKKEMDSVNFWTNGAFSIQSAKCVGILINTLISTATLKAQSYFRSHISITVM
jgi:hypothetical protein